jgi:CSLREA domain-containing protein
MKKKLFGTFLTLWIITTQSVNSAEFIVDTVADDSDPNTTSLRDAITNVNLSNDADNTIILNVMDGSVIQIDNNNGLLPALSKPVTFTAPNGNVELKLENNNPGQSWLLGSSAPISTPPEFTITVRSLENARGLYGSGDTLHIDGDFLSTIDVATDIDVLWNPGAVRIHSREGSIIIDGDLGGIIRTDAVSSQSWGVESQGENKRIFIDGSVIGTIEASTQKNNAIGIGMVGTAAERDRINDGIEITGGIGPDARIVTRSGLDFSSGLYSTGGITIGGDVDGYLASYGRDYVNNMIAFNFEQNRPYRGITIHGSLNGTMLADATRSNAYGLYSLLAPIYIGGGIGENAEIVVSSGSNFSGGIHALDGNIYIGGDIAGTIIANAEEGTATAISAVNLWPPASPASSLVTYS